MTYLNRLYEMRAKNINNQWNIDYLFDMEIYYAP